MTRADQVTIEIDRAIIEASLYHNGQKHQLEELVPELQQLHRTRRYTRHEQHRYRHTDHDRVRSRSTETLKAA